MQLTQLPTGVMVRYFPSLLSGLLLTLSFPDTGAHALVWVALVPLLVSLPPKGWTQAFKAGVAAGLFHYLTLIYWLVGTLETYGGLAWPLAWACLVLLSLYLALYPALFCVLVQQVRIFPPLGPLMGAALWVGLEYARTYLLTGFPWGLLGYSQFPNIPLIQMADITGVYGISFLIVLVNMTLAMIFRQIRNRENILKRRSWLVPAGMSFLMLTGTVLYGMARIGQVDRLMVNSEQSSIGVIQGNIRQDLKWTQSFRQETIDKYLKLSKDLMPKKPDLVVWPETAMPFYYNFDNDPSNRVDAGIRELGTHFLIGSPAVTVVNDQVRIYNRAFMLDRFSIIQGMYDKIHLVPFGEYVPFENYLTFIDKITEEAGNFSSGRKSYQPLAFGAYETGVLICFEILFPRIAAGFAHNGAHMLTTMTNDAWFGYSSATRQHFSIAVFRAVETRRCVTRAANTGISGYIDPVGRILEATELFKDKGLVRSLPMMTHQSLYTRCGDLFAWLCSLVSLAICLGIMVNKGIKKAGEKRK